MSQERISGRDDLQSAVLKLGEGNPGALSVLARLLPFVVLIDPSAFGGPASVLLNLDSAGIYGPNIWDLWRISGQNPRHFVGLVRAWQLGIVTKNWLMERIQDYTTVVPMDEILKKIRERVPDFGVAKLECDEPVPADRPSRGTNVADSSDELPTGDNPKKTYSREEVAAADASIDAADKAALAEATGATPEQVEEAIGDVEANEAALRDGHGQDEKNED